MKNINKLALLFFVTFISLADAHINTTRDPYVRDGDITCMKCIDLSYSFWCPVDQKCYYSEADYERISTISGRDCTRIEDYDKLISWDIPQAHMW